MSTRYQATLPPDAQEANAKLKCSGCGQVFPKLLPSGVCPQCEESRRRTKVIPHFFTEQACLKLVFSALWQTSQRWRRVTMTHLERQQLALRRRELGLPLYSGEQS